MNKKYATIIISLAIILLAACSPSPQAIQTAIAQTQVAIATPMSHPTVVPQPTKTLIPTPTRLPTRVPTSTPKPKTPYILETGWCMLRVGDVSGSDPKNISGCNLDARQQVQFGPNEGVDVTLNNLDGQIQVYCALFSLDGTLIMSDMDTTGSGKVTCAPK